MPDRAQHEPEASGARVYLADMLASEGKFDQAFQELDQVRAVTVNRELALGLRAKFLSRQGKRLEAEEALRQMEANPGPVAWVVRASAWLEAGNRDKAFAYLEKAYQEHDGNLLRVPNDPFWAAVRSEARFQDLFRRISGE